MKKKTSNPRKSAARQVSEAIKVVLPELKNGVIPFPINRDTPVALQSPAGNYVRTDAGVVHDRLKPPFGTLEEGVNILINALKQDPELFHGYQSNIAMAVVDEYNRFAKVHGEKKINEMEFTINVIANQAAQNFLTLFIEDDGIKKKDAGRWASCYKLKPGDVVISDGKYFTVRQHFRMQQETFPTDRLMNDMEESKNFKVTDEIKNNIQNSFDAPVKTPFVFKFQDPGMQKSFDNTSQEYPDGPLAYASAIGQFRDQHTGPALVKKFLEDVDKHVSFTELPTIAREVIAAFSAKACAEKNIKGDRYDQAAEEAKQARSIYDEMQSIFNNKS